MSAAFRNGGVSPNSGPSAGAGSDPKATHKFTTAEEGLDNAAYEAVAEHPPALKLGIGWTLFTVGIVTNLFQMCSSTIAWMAIMITGTSLPINGVTAVMQMFPWVAATAALIAICIQSLLHMQGQSMSSTWARLKQIQHFNIKSAQSAIDVKSAISLRALLGFFAIGMDIVSDATFVNLFTHNMLAIIAFTVIMTGCSTIMMYDGATRVWGAVEDYKDYTAYHAKHDPKS